MTNNKITIGKFLITPLTRALDNGLVAISVSIRSGSGRATTDRVLRFAQQFRDEVEASRYAVAEARQWIGAM